MADGGTAGEGGGAAKVRVVRCPKCQKLLPSSQVSRSTVAAAATLLSEPSGGSATTLQLFRRSSSRNSLKPDGPGKVERLEQDRAVLLQKLDELRDQLSRSCDVKGKTNEREAASRRTTSSSAFDSQGTWLKNSSSSVNRAAAARQFPLPAAHNVDSQNFYAPPPHARNEMLGYGDPFEPPLVRRGPYHPLHQYPQRTAEGYLYGQFDPESVIPYRHDAFYNQPACSYSHCYDAPWQEPPPPPPPPPPHAPPTVFPTRRAAYLANSHSLYPVDDHFMLGSDRAAEMEQAQLQAVAGGAPFIVCHNCSELLHVSPHLLSPGKALHKLRCGSCSEVISFKFDGNRLNVASPPSAMDAPSQHGEDSGDLMGQGLLRMGSRNHGAADSYSGNCEHFSGNVQSTDEKLVLSSPVPLASHETIEKDYGLNLSESENMLGLGSPSSSSEDNGTQRAWFASSEHFGYSPSDQPVGKPGEGSRSKRFDQEKMVEINDNFNHNSVKDVSITSDVESPTDDHLNHGLSQDSGEITKEEDHPKTGKGGDSFFTGFIKKSFKDFSRFNQPSDGSKSKVSVNGHHIPDRLLKRVEKLAGPIHPGEYWYDHTAGFWGVMGQPCLGIIPPFIEEFNHPMPKNCAGGNTGVTVNGRELHQKDLDLLVGRGLPADYGRSYRIDISGKVLDDASGEELDSLGKLAPTIEKVKHGFGMRVPRTPAGST
ncbi:unnamed protein product [Spirodela intermedia]|uniref:Probable zinc-ribbon domain-containing protein n=1 Tax=Spirodela intermedia TaxID=51605 RepID=A0A7I8J8Y0_SPIIN|nr:unnamed protein product [Spirodela intermedia]CAA6665883.1 unnamed protein product [Spirodela intermedia]